MEKVNIRFKELRKRLDLSQKALGDKLGLSNSGISNIESGMRSVTDKHIKLLCHEFNVNEEWLRTGTGEMFIHSEHEELSRLADEYMLDALDCKIIESYMKLSKFQRQAIKRFILDVAEQEGVSVAPPDDETMIIAAKDEGLKIVSKDKAKRDLYSEK